MPPKNSSSDEGKYASMTVLELKKVCKSKTGMSTKDCNLLRKPLVELLQKLDEKEQKNAMALKKAKKASSPGMKAKKTASDMKKSTSRPASPGPSGRKYKAGKCEHDSCPDKFCVISSGVCIGKTKKGTPLMAELTKIAKMSATQRSQILTTDDGLLGTEAEIRAIVKSSPKKSKKTRTPSPSPKKAPSPKKSPSPKKKAPKKSTGSKKASKCYEPDANACDSGKVCSGKSGRCIKDTPAARKNMKVLMVDGRPIVGSEDIIKRLQTQFGGKIQDMNQSPSPARSSQDSDEDSSEIVFETRRPSRPSPARRDSPSATIPYDDSSSEAPTPYESDDDSSEVIIPVVMPKKEVRRGKAKKATSPISVPKAKSPMMPTMPPRTRELGNSATQLRRRDIQETFMACLNSLK